MKAEISDIQEAHIEERQELEQTQNELTRDLKLKYGACISYCWPRRRTLINMMCIMNTICPGRGGYLYCDYVQTESDVKKAWHKGTMKVFTYLYAKGLAMKSIYVHYITDLRLHNIMFK